MTKSRTSIKPQVRHGQACIAGTQILPHRTVRMLANGDSVEGLLEDYPSLGREDIRVTLDYATPSADA